MTLLDFIKKRDEFVAKFLNGAINYDDFSTSITALNQEAIEKGLNPKFILTPEKLALEGDYAQNNQIETIESKEDESYEEEEYYEESSSS